MIPRERWALDPRAADYPGDSARWHALLAKAFDAHPQPHDLFGALHFARCCGARLVPDTRFVWKIEPPNGSEETAAYQVVRWTFKSHESLLKRILKSLA